MIKEKIETKKNNILNNKKESEYHKKLEKIGNSELKKKLEDLIGAYDKKNN